MATVNLEDVISDAISDSELPTETPETTEVETSPEQVELSPTETTETTETVTEGVEATSEVSSPAARQAAQVKAEPDEFEKKFGIPAQSSSGRENRIPHSRVQKIVAKAVKDAETSFTPKLQEVETKFTEAQAKITDYEGRLQKVAEFENLMVNDSDKFLGLLAQLPQYKDKLASLGKAQTPANEAPVVESDGMPQPDYELNDGSKVYSMEGLKALNAWNRAQAREEVLTEIDKRYGPKFKSLEPIEQSYQSFRAQQELVPKIQAQIAEARTWPMFNENEADITTALQQNPQLSLEGAYRKVVFPKITADRNKMREDLMREIKSAPTSTAAPSRAVRQAPAASSGPRDMFDVIKEQVDAHLR